MADDTTPEPPTPAAPPDLAPAPLNPQDQTAATNPSSIVRASQKRKLSALLEAAASASSHMQETSTGLDNNIEITTTSIHTLNLENAKHQQYLESLLQNMDLSIRTLYFPTSSKIELEFKTLNDAQEATHNTTKLQFEEKIKSIEEKRDKTLSQPAPLNKRLTALSQTAKTAFRDLMLSTLRKQAEYNDLQHRLSKLNLEKQYLQEKIQALLQLKLQQRQQEEHNARTIIQSEEKLARMTLEQEARQNKLKITEAAIPRSTPPAPAAPLEAITPTSPAPAAPLEAIIPTSPPSPAPVLPVPPIAIAPPRTRKPKGIKIRKKPIKIYRLPPLPHTSQRTQQHVIVECASPTPMPPKNIYSTASAPAYPVRKPTPIVSSISKKKPQTIKNTNWFTWNKTQYSCSLTDAGKQYLQQDQTSDNSSKFYFKSNAPETIEAQTTPKDSYIVITNGTSIPKIKAHGNAALLTEKVIQAIQANKVTFIPPTNTEKAQSYLKAFIKAGITIINIKSADPEVKKQLEHDFYTQLNEYKQRHRQSLSSTLLHSRSPGHY